MFWKARLSVLRYIFLLCHNSVITNNNLRKLNIIRYYCTYNILSVSTFHILYCRGAVSIDFNYNDNVMCNVYRAKCIIFKRRLIYPPHLPSGKSGSVACVCARQVRLVQRTQINHTAKIMII